MQTTKMSLASIKGKLSRTEMKKIMAGSGNTTCLSCKTNQECWQVNKGDCKKQCAIGLGCDGW